jgi:TATA-box binding protein (TBP) (component of TFIID and TFIIIB)
MIKKEAATLGKPRPVPSRTKDFVSRMGKGGHGDAAFMRYARMYVWPENVVVQMRLASDMEEFRKVSASWWNAYIPNRFETSAVRVCTQGSITVLLFGTGSAVLAGTKAPEHTFQGAHRIRLDLAALGKNVAFEQVRLVNQVYNTTLATKSGVDLGKMNVANMGTSQWDPDKFPGIKIKDVELGARVSLFDTMKVVYMGLKESWRIDEIIAKVTAMAEQYPDDNLPSPEDRWAYRKERRRLAFNSIVASDMVPID